MPSDVKRFSKLPSQPTLLIPSLIFRVIPLSRYLSLLAYIIIFPHFSNSSNSLVLSTPLHLTDSDDGTDVRNESEDGNHEDEFFDVDNGS